MIYLLISRVFQRPLVVASLCFWRGPGQFLTLWRHKSFFKFFDLGLISNYLTLDCRNHIFEALVIGSLKILVAPSKIRALVPFSWSSWNFRSGLHFTRWSKFFLTLFTNKLREGYRIPLSVILCWSENIFLFVHHSTDIAVVQVLLSTALNKRLTILDTSCLRRLDRSDGSHRRPTIVALVWAASANVTLTCISLTLTLPVSLVQLHYLLDLLLCFRSLSYKILLEKILSNQDSLLVYDIVELAIVFFKNFILVVFLVLIILQVRITHIEA